MKLSICVPFLDAFVLDQRARVVISIYINGKWWYQMWLSIIAKFGIATILGIAYGNSKMSLQRLHGLTCLCCGPATDGAAMGRL